ncbi:oxidoreductase [Hufsiella ginkgonis]|uniref:SDR family NAD(P)-dependent oxidoreductase n=1 Tax=Hufsiella ginkgonis TaxID=2695274 RepID=A0A7K1XW02_9SPHI|nr:oxidoreductase [Hufsiella ginkgonis]MXV15150.1 SDR family NAD(P)-dependent oxidoreductase [Hufsiella ginkgonis]
MASEQVWFITGCSTGFGRELATEVLSKGYKAAVAARNTADIADIISAYPDTAFPVKLDVTKAEEIVSSVEAVQTKFGQIDVLVNNAGIGYFASLEESDEHEVRRMFEVNVFGLASLTQKVLPAMRARRSGHILNVASIGGLVAFPGISFYNATKFAVVGLSESLSKEVAPLGIKVTVIAPSGFRTDWAGRSANETHKGIEDYDTTAGANIRTIRGYSGKQPGDPVRAAKAIIAAVESPEPPLYLLLGANAMKGGRAKLEVLKKDFDAWEETTVGADFPPGE